LVAPFATRAWTQNIERYEGILIDTSGSISRGGTSSELFREYLTSTKNLRLTEPANTQVWVSSISTDSFGGVHEVMKGWTHGAHGIFTDDLNRARRELASNFEVICKTSFRGLGRCRLTDSQSTRSITIAHSAG
jgi:hypothetical protein